MHITHTRSALRNQLQAARDAVRSHEATCGVCREAAKDYDPFEEEACEGSSQLRSRCFGLESKVRTEESRARRSADDSYYADSYYDVFEGAY